MNKNILILILTIIVIILALVIGVVIGGKYFANNLKDNLTDKVITNQVKKSAIENDGGEVHINEIEIDNDVENDDLEDDWDNDFDDEFDESEDFDIDEDVESFYIDNFKFVLKFEDENAISSIQEYILEGETLELYSHLFSIQIINNVLENPIEYRNNIATNLTLMGFDVVKHPNKTMLYFAVEDPDGNFVEYDAFEYLENNEGSGIKIYQFVQRDYRVKTLGGNPNEHAVALFELLQQAIDGYESELQK
jgi:competence protein ComGC